MELSIIIASYKNPDLTRVCIEAIRKNTKTKDYEIIVVDSATEEDTDLMMRNDFAEIKFFPFKDNVGFQHMVRSGIEASSGKYILILNGDIIVKNDSIDRLLQFVKTSDGIGIAGPQLLNFNETLQYSCFRFYTPFTILYRRTPLGRLGFAKKHLSRFLMEDFDHQTQKDVDWLMGSALMTTREALNKVGLMDPRFKMYLEDTDWCRRFWEHGYRVVYYPESKMYHYHGRGSAGRSVFRLLLSNRLTWIHIFSAIKYFIKYFGKSLPEHN
jgi:GT2 family glycosyltransferase